MTAKQLTGRLAFFAMVLAVLMVSVTATVRAIRWLDRPFAGFLVSDRMVVGALAQQDWPGIRAGLAFPDKILSADGQPVPSVKHLQRVVQSVPVGHPVRYSVERNGQVFEVTVPTIRFTLLDLIMTFGLAFLSGLGYLLIGILVFLLKPDTRVSCAFLVASVSLSVYAIASFDIQSRDTVRVLLFANSLFPAAFLHLSFLFPEAKRFVERHPSAQLIPYIVAAVLLLPPEFLYPRSSFLPFYQLVRLYAVVGALAFLASALHAYYSKASALARQRAKVVLVGAALAFPIPALDHVLTLFGDVLARATTQNNLLTLPVLIFPASIAYAIAKHNLFDVDVYVKRAVGYGIMTTLVATAYFSIQTLMGTFVLDPVFGGYRDTVYPIVFALLVVFLFNPLNRKVQESVDRIFFRKQFDYKQTISAVSNALTSMLHLDQIVTQVVHTIRREMFVETAGVLILEQQQKTWRTFFLVDGPMPGEDQAKHLVVGYDDPLLALLRAEKTLITRYDIEEDPRFEDVRAACLKTFADMASSVAIPLTYQGEVSGVLALGHKKSGHFYSREDIDLLTTMANQAAVAIENSTAHEEVVRYAAELEASLRRIQILESIKASLAKFVPRTVQELIEESPEAPSLEKREADVSVLFADMTGYTRLSAQMELDQVNRLVERYFGAFLDEILREGGDVNETAGDGLMVIFRDPDPRRHARAAALAALGIQRRTWEINAQLRGQSEPITMKVGLNSGIASVGATKIEGAAGTRWTYTASGPTTNVAARLAALGEGGGIVLSEETRRRLGDEFRVEDLGLQSLKNVAHPLQAYRLTGEEREPLDVRVRGAAGAEGVAQ